MLIGLDAALRWSPLQLASGWMASNRLAVLAFHGVDDPRNFEILMDFLVREYHVVSPESVLQAMDGSHSLPQKAVLITFDDGYRSVYEHGLPILAERGLTGIAFVIAGLLSTQTDFWWSAVESYVHNGAELAELPGASAAELVRHLKQVSNESRLELVEQLRSRSGSEADPRPQLEPHELIEMERGGITIGNHTWSHPCLNRCDTETTRSEIVDADKTLRELMDRKMDWFAYPNGDWSPGAEATLGELGYRGAFLFDHRLADVAANPLRLSRLRVNSDTSLDRFAIILTGLHSALHRARRRT